MNIKLVKEIYGNAWYMDPISFIQLSKTLEIAKNSNYTYTESEKSNQFGILNQDQVFNARRISRMDVVPQGTIAMYNFDSVITKHGGMSHYGTVDISKQFSQMEANDNVIGHIFKIESGGGSSNAIQYIREVSAKGKRSKSLVVYAEDVMASAAMYIASDADYIIVNSKDAMVGSIGTMISLEGFKNGEKDENGKVHARIYATKSVNKNHEFEKAINESNYELIRSSLLDPTNEIFIKDMEANRPNIRSIEKTGQIFRAEDVVGTLIDSIGNFQSAIDKVNEISNFKNTPSSSGENNNNKKNKSMDLVKLKQEHPALYNEVFQLGEKNGMKSERERVSAWSVYMDIDPEKVKAGIEGDKAPSMKDQNEFVLASMNVKKVTSMEDENAEETNTSKNAKTEEEIKAEKQKVEMDELFNEEGE